MFSGAWYSGSGHRDLCPSTIIDSGFSNMWSLLLLMLKCRLTAPLMMFALMMFFIMVAALAESRINIDG
jgi:hypothetical protein